MLDTITEMIIGTIIIVGIIGFVAFWVMGAWFMGGDD